MNVAGGCRAADVMDAEIMPGVDSGLTSLLFTVLVFRVLISRFRFPRQPSLQQSGQLNLSTPESVPAKVRASNRLV